MWISSESPRAWPLLRVRRVGARHRGVVVLEICLYPSCASDSVSFTSVAAVRLKPRLARRWRRATTSRSDGLNPYATVDCSQICARRCRSTMTPRTGSHYCGSSGWGRMTFKSLGSLRVVSACRMRRCLSYILIVSRFTRCLTRTPSTAAGSLGHHVAGGARRKFGSIRPTTRISSRMPEAI